MEQRPEVDKGLGKADGAAAVKHQIRGVAVVVLVCPRRAVHRLSFALLARRADVHQQAEQAHVVVDAVGRRQERRAGGEGRGSVVRVQRGPKAELELALVGPVGARHVAAVASVHARVGAKLKLDVVRHGPLQRLQACLHDEEEQGRAERAALLDAHRSRHRHRLAVKVEGHLEIRVHALDHADQVRRHAELAQDVEEYAPRHRVERLNQVHEENPGL